MVPCSSPPQILFQKLICGLVKLSAEFRIQEPSGKKIMGVLILLGR